MIILHPSRGHGAPFKLLGCMVDTDLRMHSCIDQLLSKIRPRITAILRTRGFYSIPDLIIHFRTHIWDLIEMNIGGYFHAASSLLAEIDHAQNRFLHELRLSSEHAFLEFNFAVPEFRRNIAVLELFQKRVLAKCHPSFDKLMPWYSDRHILGRTDGRSNGQTDGRRDDRTDGWTDGRRRSDGRTDGQSNGRTVGRRG